MTIDSRSIRATALAAFTEEFQQSLPGILNALETVRADRGDQGAAREAYRLVHALKGGASMVGLAALSYLLNVAEELVAESLEAAAPLPDEAVETLQTSMPRFAAYIESALTGQPIDRLAVGLARALKLGGAAADPDLLRELVEIEAREIALLPADAPAADDDAEAGESLDDLAAEAPPAPEFDAAAGDLPAADEEPAEAEP